MNPSGDSRSIDGGSLSGQCPSLPPVQEGDRSYTGNGSINSCHLNGEDHFSSLSELSLSSSG